MKKVLVVAALLLVFILYFALDLGDLLVFDTLLALVDENPSKAFVVFFFLYLLVAVLNLPGIGPLAFVSGAAFGLINGTLVVSFASAIGATISFFTARTLIRDWVERRFGSFLKIVNKGVAEDGLAYLFTLRMIPFIPFFIVNPVFGLTNMRLWQFYLVTQLGMLPIVLLYVNVGTSIGAIDEVSFSGVFTPQIILSFTLLITFPFAAKRIAKTIKSYRKL